MNKHILCTVLLCFILATNCVSGIFNAKRSRNIAEVDCAIIGAGPAGLITAIQLLHTSPTSTIARFEKDNFEPKGASVQISLPGWESIQVMDKSLSQKLKKTGVPVYGFDIKPWGSESNDTATTSLSKSERFWNVIHNIYLKMQNKLLGLKMKSVGQDMHRWHDVRITLKEHLLELYNDKTKAIEEKECIPFLDVNSALIGCKALNQKKPAHRFELTFQSDTSRFKVRSKYLFACDGSKSVVRSLLPKEPNILISENRSVWRGLAPNIVTNGKALYFRGSAKEGVASVFPTGKQVGSSWTVISDEVSGKSESSEESKKRVLQVLSSMDDFPFWEKIIADTDIIIENKLFVRDFDKPWESAYEGLVYVGDALHPVRPTGQAIGMALEDAKVLGEVIRKQNDINDAALRDYEKERYLPVKELSEEIRAAAKGFYKKKD